MQMSHCLQPNQPLRGHNAAAKSHVNAAVKTATGLNQLCTRQETSEK